MKRIILFLIAGLMLNGCKTVMLSELSPTGRNQYLLPPLDIVLDESSFGSAFGLTKSYSYGTLNAVNSNIGLITTSSNSTTYSNPNIRDIHTIFSRDMENFSESYGEKKGYAVCRLITGNSKQVGYGWAALSGLTLLIPNFFGMPFFSHKSYMQIEVSIYKKDQNLIGKYLSSPKISKVPIAMWHGYGIYSAEKQTIITTFKDCMNDIKMQISQDYSRLSRELR